MRLLSVRILPLGELLHILKIPEDCEVAINIAMGYADESPEAPIRHSDKVKIIK